jgi:hypothetical protein
VGLGLSGQAVVGYCLLHNGTKMTTETGIYIQQHKTRSKSRGSKEQDKVKHVNPTAQNKVKHVNPTAQNKVKHVNPTAQNKVKHVNPTAQNKVKHVDPTAQNTM